MTPLEKAHDAIKSLEDANPYDPGDVETALDSVASTLTRAFLKPRKFSLIRKTPSLEDVLEQLSKKGLAVADGEEALSKIREILDENAYPDDQEIEDSTEMEDYLISLSKALLPLVSPPEEHEEQ